MRRDSFRALGIAIAGMGLLTTVMGLMGLNNESDTGNWVTYGAIAAILGTLMATGLIRLRSKFASQEDEERPCPHCSEAIKSTARVCRYCGRDVEPILRPMGETAAGGLLFPSEEPRLRAEIMTLKDGLRGMQYPYPAADLYELGRLYALLFDMTGEVDHRAAALKYMTAASDSDGSFFDGFFGGGELRSFGALEADPDFRGFAS